MMNQNTRVVTRPLTAYGLEPEHSRLEHNADDQLLFDDFNKDVWDEGGKLHHMMYDPFLFMIVLIIVN